MTDDSAPRLPPEPNAPTAASETVRARSERMRASLVRAIAARMSPKLRAAVDPDDVRMEAIAALRATDGSSVDENDVDHRRRVMESAVRVLAAEAKRRLGKPDRPPALDPRALEDAVARTAVAPATLPADRAEAAGILRALATLPPFAREVLAHEILRLADAAEIAEAVGRPVAEVTEARTNGLAALRAAIEPGPSSAGAGADAGIEHARAALERAAFPTVVVRLPEPPAGYRLLRALGRGGMGVVYEAVRAVDGRHVALKALTSAAKSDVEAVVRFRREARAAAALNHPRLVRVVDYGVASFGPFYAMEFVGGGDLARLIARTRVRGTDGMPQDVAARGTMLAAHFAELADALSYAHSQGVVHRDVKPSNVFVLPDGGLKLGDFGLATLTGGARAAKDGVIVGSAATMAPEQARGEAWLIGPRTDVYSFGATLYEALTLKPAFEGEDFTGTAEAVVRGVFVPPSSCIAGLSPDLEAVVLKAMAYRPGDRYPTAAAFAADLRAAAVGLPVVAARRSKLSSVFVLLRRRPLLLLALVALLLAAAVFALL